MLTGDLTSAAGSTLLLELLVVGVATAALAYTILELSMNRVVSLAEGFLLGGLTIGIIVLLVQSIGTIHFFWLLAALLAAVLALRGWPRRVHSQRRREMLEADIRQCRVALQRDPQNAAAYSYLGRAFEQLGRLEEAVEAYQQALALAPGEYEDRHRLERLSRELAQQQAGARRCPRCQAALVAGEDECPQCTCPVSPLGGFYEIFGKSPSRALAFMLGLGALSGLVVFACRQSLACGLALVGLIWLVGAAHIWRTLARRR